MRRRRIGPGGTGVFGAAIAAVLILAAAAPQRSAAQPAPASLAGAHLHLAYGNAHDNRVAGPVNVVIDTAIESAGRDEISYTVSSILTRVGGGVSLRMVTRVRITPALVWVKPVGNSMTNVRIECKDGSNCIAWSVVSYFNENASVQAPAGGMELGSNLTDNTGAPTLGRVYSVLCTLAECRN